MEMKVDMDRGFFFLQPTGSDMAILFFYAANLTRRFFFFDRANPTRCLGGMFFSLRDYIRGTPQHTTYDTHHIRQWRQRWRHWISV